jgi:hypothetical protein
MRAYKLTGNYSQLPSGVPLISSGVNAAKAAQVKTLTIP